MFRNIHSYLNTCDVKDCQQAMKPGVQPHHHVARVLAGGVRGEGDQASDLCLRLLIGGAEAPCSKSLIRGQVNNIKIGSLVEHY